jgi:hypothetical protein
MEHNPLSVWRRAQTVRGVPRGPSEGKPICLIAPRWRSVGAVL